MAFGVAAAAIGLAALPARAEADPARLASAVVKVSADIVENGSSVESLGAHRTGSGVILDERTVLTIGYLVMEAEQVMVQTAGGRRIPASVQGYDHGSGFGLLRTVVPLEGEAVELGDSDTVMERERVLTIGQGEPEATPVLVLSRKPFVGSWEYRVERALFTFPPVHNWSGSALLTRDGKLIGIGSLIVGDAAADREGVPGNMFVPINLLKPILSDLRARGRSRNAQPWLGMATETVRGHLMVTRVSPGSPAEQAGVGAGDIVLGVGEEAVDDQADFYRRVWSLGPAGTVIPVKLLKARAGGVQEARIRSVDRNEVLRRPAGV